MAANELLIVLKALDKASRPIDGVSDSLGSLEGSSKSLLDRGLNPLQSMLGTGLKIAAGAAVGAVAGIGAAFGASVNSAMQMEQSVADIAAVMGMTMDEAQPLKDLIKDLGIDPKLKVTATEAAEAIGMLGQNGLTVQQILDGAARSTVLLANATGADFGTAAAIATDAMNIFGIEANNVGQVVDGVAAVLIQSKLGVDDYRLALSNAGGMAKTIGLSMEDFNTTIAAIPSYFSGGSDAGTGFKTFLQRLIPTTKDATEWMGKLGLLTENGTSAFFDANGQLKDMATIVGMLNRATSSLSAEQRTQAFNTIFGTDAMRAAAAIADMTEESFRALQKSMANVDAEQMAATRMATLSGAIEILMGVISAIGLEIGEVFLPLFTKFVTAFSDFLSEHSEKVIAWAQSFGEFIGKLAESWLPPTIEFVKKFFEAIWTLGNYLWTVVTTGDVFNKWLDSVPEPLRVFATGVGYIVSALREFVLYVWANVLDPILELIKQYVSLTDVLMGLGLVIAWSASRSIVAAFGAFIAAYWPVAAVLAGAILAVSLVRNAWEKDWWDIRERTRAVLEYLGMRFGLLWTTLKVSTAGALAEIWAFVTGNETDFKHLSTIWEVTKLTARLFFEDIVRYVKTNWPLWRDALIEWGKASWQWILDAKKEIGIKMGEWYGELKRWTDINYPIWKAQIGTWSLALWEWIKEAIPLALGSMWEWLKALGGWLIEKGPEWDRSLSKFFIGAFDYLGKVIPNVIHKLGDLIVNLMRWSSTDAVEGFKQGLGALSQVSEQEGDSVTSAFLNAFGNILIAIVEVAIQIGTAFVFWLGQSILSWAGLDIDLWKFYDRLAGTIHGWKIWDLAKAVWAKFSGGTTESFAGPVLTAFQAGWGALVTAFNAVSTSLRNHVYEPAKGIWVRVSDAIKSVNLASALVLIWTPLVNTFNTVRLALWNHVWTPTRDIAVRVAMALRDVDLAGNFQLKWTELVNRFNEQRAAFWNHVWTPTRSVVERVAYALRDVDFAGNFQLRWNELTNRFNEQRAAFWNHVWTPTRDIVVRMAYALRDVDLAGNFQLRWTDLTTRFTEQRNSFWTHVWTPTRDIMVRIAYALRDVDLAGNFGLAWDRLVDAFNTWSNAFWEHVWTPMKDIGKRVIDGLLSGLQEKWNQVTSWFSNLGSYIPQWVRMALGIASPSKVFMEIGEQIMEGLAIGVQEFASGPKLALEGAVSGMVAGAAQSVVNTTNRINTNNINVVIPNSAPIDDPEGSSRRYLGTLTSMFA